jgi:hypothetical protein
MSENICSTCKRDISQGENYRYIRSETEHVDLIDCIRYLKSQLSQVRVEVARECAEIVKSQEIVWIGKHFPEEDTEATLNAAADAIRAKFGVTE